MPIHYTSNPIPVKLYVKQFIEAGNVIKPFILKTIYSLFTKEKVVLSPTLFDGEYQGTIKFPIPEVVFLKNGYALSRRNIDMFNDILEGYIKLLFECELEANIRRSIKEERKFSIQEMIVDLRKKFGLDEDNLPFETIKKALQRFCERENVDLQAIKIYAKSVPKKRCSVRISSEFIPRKEFLEKFNISKDTYSKMKNVRGQLSVVKKGKEDYINIALSDIPPVYVVTFTQ
jgi:hypothetical protein